MMSEGCSVSARDRAETVVRLNPLNLLRIMPAKEREFVE